MDDIHLTEYYAELGITVTLLRFPRPNFIFTAIAHDLMRRLEGDLAPLLPDTFSERKICFLRFSVRHIYEITFNVDITAADKKIREEHRPRRTFRAISNAAGVIHAAAVDVGVLTDATVTHARAGTLQRQEVGYREKKTKQLQVVVVFVFVGCTRVFVDDSYTEMSNNYISQRVINRLISERSVWRL